MKQSPRPHPTRYFPAISLGTLFELSRKTRNHIKNVDFEPARLPGLGDVTFLRDFSNPAKSKNFSDLAGFEESGAKTRQPLSQAGGLRHFRRFALILGTFPAGLGCGQGGNVET